MSSNRDKSKPASSTEPLSMFHGGDVWPQEGKSSSKSTKDVSKSPLRSLFPLSNSPSLAQQHAIVSSWNEIASRSVGTLSGSSLAKSHPVKYGLRLVRIKDFLELILSYPMRIGYEEFLKQRIKDVYHSWETVLRATGNDDYCVRRVKYLLYDERPLRYAQILIPQRITDEMINNDGSIKNVPQPILLLATRLALRQLAQTLTSNSWLPHYKIQNIWFSTRNDAEKRTVVKNIQANSQIRAAFVDIQIIDLNRIDDETERELMLLDPQTWLQKATGAKSKKYRRGRHLVLVVDGDGDEKLDPLRVSLPIKGGSQQVVVLITTLSSSDYLTNRVDLTIKTGHHLLPWELFCNIVGVDLLHSSVTIHEIAVQIVQKCEGHLLAILLMAKSLKDVKDVQIWELALENLRYRDRQAIANAFFHSILAKVISETERVRLIRCLMVFKSQDLMISDSDLFARWISEQLVDTKEEAEIILQDFMGCSVLLQFEDTRGQQILLPHDIKIILYVFGEDILENLSEGASVSTISSLQVSKVSLLPHLEELNLEELFKLHNLKTLSQEYWSQLLEQPQGITKLMNLKTLRLMGYERLETLPQVIWELEKLEDLSLEHCSQLRELPPQITKLEKLKTLRLLGCQQLKTLPPEIWKLERLETLSLEHCSQLMKLPPQITKLEKLKTLKWSGCQQLETLPQEIWKLEKLETLSVKHCSRLLELPPEINKLKRLKTLRLAGCERLETLPKEIWKLKKLETLSLEHCSQLQRLPHHIKKLENLKTLRLIGCKRLEALPREIRELDKLETLSLELWWQLCELPQQITKLENLKTLRLTRCEHLKSLPQEVWELEKLESLSLEHCLQLRELPQQIIELENLKTLRLTGCKKLETLPQEIWGLKKLESLSLECFSQLREVPPQITKLEKLQTLRLVRCERLETLSQEIWKLEKLKTLSLEHCSRLLELPPQLQLQNIEIFNLSGTQITRLPPILNFPKLRSLFLGNNLNLMKIPSSFFNHVPLLRTLDLSGTSIHELPSSIFNLQELRKLYLKDCELFGELPPEISQLINLTTLDLNGTLITHLPKKIQALSNLESLSLSLYNDSSFEVIPLGVLSTFTHLKTLRIDVNPDNEWWLKNVVHILTEINVLHMLRALDIYIPRDSFLNPIERHLHNFRFIIGHHKPRMISPVPSAIELMFKESSPSLKFINGQDFPNEVKSILRESWAFFLDRHMVINHLSEFELKNLKQLRLCILAECNEMQSIVDMDECGSNLDLNESFFIQFLTIFNMRSLRSIINKPILGNSIFCELKLLALHTCPELTTIFTMHSLHSLVNLEELIVEDCPKVSCIIACPSDSNPTTKFFLPRLRKLSLIFVPELESISNGVCIGRNLEQMGLYYCPKLQSLSTAELSSEKLKVIRGEMEWWEALQWSEAEWGQQDRPHKFNEIFSAIDEDLDIFTQLTTYDELMTSFNRENSGELQFFSEERDSESHGLEWNA